MMTVYIDIIKKTPLFSDLSDSEIELFMQKGTLIDLEDGDILFKRNDPADAMYILLSGYLLISIDDATGKPEQINSIHEGELVGELGMLTGKPRTASAKALIKSKLIKFTLETFFWFVYSHPKFAEKVILVLAERAHHSLMLFSQEAKTRLHTHFTLISFGEKASVFVKKLEEMLENHPRIHFCNQQLLLDFFNRNDSSGLLNYIDHIEKNARCVVYNISVDFKNYPKKLVELLLHRTNTVLFVYDGHDFSSEINNHYLQIKNKIPIGTKIELALVWGEHESIHGTERWLNSHYYHFHHHVNTVHTESYHRFIRYLSGRSIGLVLGGGGSRVWYHLGVLKALMEKKIQLDAIGGTSAGAAIAAYFLTSSSFEEVVHITEVFSRSMQKALELSNLTYPLISLFNARPITKTAFSIFHNKHIEDLPIPYFAVASNINTYSQHVFNEGLLWKALRATSALPGIFPPLEHNGQLLYDGGLINNLPTEVMRKWLGKEATIIASDISIDENDTHNYALPPTLPLLLALKEKFKISKTIHHPPFMSTLIRAMLVGSIDQYKKNLKHVNIHIHSDLREYDLFTFDHAVINSLVTKGYESTIRALSQWK